MRKMAQIDFLFMTKTAENTTPWFRTRITYQAVCDFRFGKDSRDSLFVLFISLTTANIEIKKRKTNRTEK